MTAFSIANLTVSNNTISVLRSIAQDLARNEQNFNAAGQPITPAAAPVANQLRNQVNLNQIQQQALAQSSAIIGVSIKGVSDITKTLTNLRQIVQAAAQPGVSNDQLQALAQQFNQGLSSIQTSLKGASLAGVDLLNGTNTQNFLANGLSANDLRTLNLQTGVLDVLTANSLQNAINHPPDPFANLVNGIVSAVKAQFGGTSDATAQAFANQFIDQIGRGNPTQVQALGNQLINVLNGTAQGNEGTRQLVDHAVDAIANGAPQATVSGLIGGVISSLTNAGQGGGDQGQGNGNNNVQGGDNQGQGNAFAFGQTGDVGRGNGDGHHGGDGGDGGGSGGGGVGPPDLTGVLSSLDKALAAATNSLTVLNRENQSIKDQSNSLANLNSTLNSQVGALVNINLTSQRAQVLAQQLQSALGTQIISITGARARSILHSLLDNAVGAGAGSRSSPFALTNPFPTLNLAPPQTNLFNIHA
ncbi:MAG TPA: hypothetical protein VGB82_01920 [Alphaproteobacteria bacterium]